MESFCPPACPCNGTDPGPAPFVTPLARASLRNQNFRTVVWTGSQLQLTVMCIPVCGEIGLEIHPDTDQLIRVEDGQALVRMGKDREASAFQRRIGTGDAVLVPCGTWHNVINTGNRPLKLSSLYAPPHHPKGTIHRTKADAEHEEQPGW